MDPATGNVINIKTPNTAGREVRRRPPALEDGKAENLLYLDAGCAAKLADTMANGRNPGDSDDLLEWLSATARGDRQAFARLYQASSGQLFGTALRLLGHREAAEDVLQEAYLTIWQKAEQYRRERGHPMAWMNAILRSRAIDRLRRDGREPRRTVEWSESSEAEVSIEFRAGDLPGHVAGTLRKCLERLSESQRRTILMAYYYGLTHEELAQQLETPLGTIKSWVRRGLLQLKDCVEQ